MDKESVTTHLQIVHTWASFARERDLNFFTAKHLEKITDWMDDALALLKKQQQELWELQDQAEYLADKKKEQETTDTGKRRIFECEKCGYGIDDIFLSDEEKYQIIPKYCPNCGRSVK